MAIVIVNEMHGGSQDLYDKVTDRVMPGGQLPQGCRDHIAGPIEGGWRVITVWESEDQFDQFRNGTLIPALQEAGAGETVAPKMTTNAVHRHLTA